MRILTSRVPLSGIGHRALTAHTPKKLPNSVIGRRSAPPAAVEDPRIYLGEKGMLALCALQAPHIAAIAHYLKANRLSLRNMSETTQQQVALGVAEWVHIDRRTLDSLNVFGAMLEDCRVWRPVSNNTPHADVVNNSFSLTMNYCERFLNPSTRGDEYGLAIEISAPAKRRHTATSFTKDEFRDLFHLLLVGDMPRYNKARVAKELPALPIPPENPAVEAMLMGYIIALLEFLPPTMNHALCAQLAHHMMKKDISEPAVFGGTPVRLIFLPLLLDDTASSQNYILCSLPYNTQSKTGWGAAQQVEQDLGALASVRIQVTGGKAAISEHGNKVHSEPLLKLSEILAKSMGWAA